jgi:hypothetical protein
MRLVMEAAFSRAERVTLTASGVVTLESLVSTQASSRSMPTTAPRGSQFDLHAAAERGEARYAELRARLELEHPGEFLVLDVDSDDYEIARDDTTATLRLMERRPNAVTYGVRIGRSEAYTIGHVLDGVPE